MNLRSLIMSVEGTMSEEKSDSEVTDGKYTKGL